MYLSLTSDLRFISVCLKVLYSSFYAFKQLSTIPCGGRVLLLGSPGRFRLHTHTMGHGNCIKVLCWVCAQPATFLALASQLAHSNPSFGVQFLQKRNNLFHLISCFKNNLKLISIQVVFEKFQFKICRSRKMHYLYDL